MAVEVDEGEPELRDYFRLRVIHPVIEALVSMAILTLILVLLREKSEMPDLFIVLLFTLAIFLLFHIYIYYLGTEVMLRNDGRVAMVFVLASISYFLAISVWPLIIFGDGLYENLEKLVISLFFILPPMQYMITVLWLSRQRILLARSILLISLYYLLLFGFSGVLS